VLGEGLAHHLGGELGVHRVFGDFAPRAQRRLQGVFVLRGVDLAELGHAPQHVLLALLGALRIGDRVIERGCLRQPGQHRGLGERELVERLAVVGLRCRGESIGALPEINLVDVELEDLLLGQAVLDLEGEQGLVELAREGLLG
jgi:hypothetical protein